MKLGKERDIQYFILHPSYFFWWDMGRQELKDYLFAEANSCIGGILKELSKRGLIRNNQDAFNATKHCISDGVHGMRRGILREMEENDGQCEEGTEL